MSDDIYQQLPDDLLEALRDPRTVLPGEHAVYERVVSWTMSPALPATAPPPGAWVEIRTGRSLTGTTPSRIAS